MFVEKFVNQATEFLKSFEKLEWNTMHSKIMEIKKRYDNLFDAEKAKEISLLEDAQNNKSKNVQTCMKEMLAKYICHICHLEKNENNLKWFFGIDQKNSNADITLDEIEKRIKEAKELIDFETNIKDKAFEDLDFLEQNLQGSLESILDQFQQNFLFITDKIEQSREKFNFIEMYADIVYLERGYIQLESNGKLESEYVIGEDGEFIEKNCFKEKLKEIAPFYIKELLELNFLKLDLERYGDNYGMIHKKIETQIDCAKKLIKYLDTEGMKFLNRDSRQVLDDLNELHKTLTNNLLSVQKNNKVVNKAVDLTKKIVGGVGSVVTSIAKKKNPTKECQNALNAESIYSEDDWTDVVDKAITEKSCALSDSKKDKQNLPNTNSAQVMLSLEVIGVSNKTQTKQQEKSEKASEKELVLGDANSYKPVVSQIKKSVKNFGFKSSEKANKIANTIVDKAAGVKEFISNFSLTNTK